MKFVCWLLVAVGLSIAACGWTAEYERLNRRDPFVDPRIDLGGKLEDPLPGLEGKRLTEVRLRGIWLLGEEPMALLAASDGMGYVVREGALLRDARVDSIDFETGRIVMQQRLEDWSAPQRTVRQELELKP
jgi:hypothetical protein